MKNNNLTPGILARFSALMLLLASLAMVPGCSGYHPAPTAAERYLFTVQTNAVPVVTNWTETVWTTNAAGQVETRNLVTWATNIESHVTYIISTNAAGITQTAGRLTNMFFPGFGELVAGILAGALGLWARLRSTISRGKTAQVSMAQSIETLLAIIDTTPQGKELTEKLKLKLVQEQAVAGVLREISSIVATHVDNDAAKKAAKLILDTLPKT
jgi:hypothetical protein